MPNNLGRDQLWTKEVWADIDKAVLDEVGSIRVVQKVFSSTNMPNAANVPADKFDADEMKIAEGITKPFIEISVEFSLTQSQVDNEATLHTGRTLAKLAAKSLALAEDTLLLQGHGAQLPNRMKVINRQSAEEGLIGVGDGRDIPVRALEPGGGTTAVYGASLFTAVTNGIAELNKKGQPGPYALLLESSVYADAFSPVANTLATTADRLTPLLTGGFYGTGALPKDTGLLVSLGGEPTTIYIAQDAITAYTQEDGEGNYRFRVFERVQFVARDRAAFVNMKFQAAARAAKA
jgi:uncharacterized linocin/CFP29 family protein